MKTLGVVLGIAACAAACETVPEKVVIDAASPNASIQPAPLASEAEAADASAAERQGADSPNASAQAFAAQKEPPADTLAAHDVSGVTLAVAWRWQSVPTPPKAPEVNLDAIGKAQKLTALTWNVDLADNGRMRVVFTSRALPLPTYAEIRSRADEFGSIVVWPNESDYRVIPPGSVRTVIGERRVDVTPLSQAAIKPQGEGKRLGVATRKLEITSSLATLKIELGKVPEAGDGGQLFCRLLLEMAGVDPHSSACQAGEVALAASYAWQDGGGVGLEATSLTKRTDLAPSDLSVPPSGAHFRSSGLPDVGDGVFLSREELSAFRTGIVQLPPVTDAKVPGEGFLAVNRTDVVTYVLLDGIPVAAVPANHELYVIGPLRGRYNAAWRTFLGEHIEPAKTIEMPARLVHSGPAGEADAGPDAK